MRGDATEAGILKCYEAVEGNSGEVREQNPKLIGIPFNSRNKYQVICWTPLARLKLLRPLYTRWRAASTGSS